MDDEDALSTLLYQLDTMTKNGRIVCHHGSNGYSINNCGRCKANGLLESDWLQEHRMRWLDEILEDERLLERIRKLIEERTTPPDVIKLPGSITWSPASGGTITGTLVMNGTSTTGVAITGSSVTAAGYRAILGLEAE